MSMGGADLCIMISRFLPFPSIRSGFYLVSKKENMTGTTRKKNGEGSVFQISENKWIAKISLGTETAGKPIIKQFSGKTEAIVKKKLRDFKKTENFIRRIPKVNSTVGKRWNLV